MAGAQDIPEGHQHDVLGSLTRKQVQNDRLKIFLGNNIDRYIQEIQSFNRHVSNSVRAFWTAATLYSAHVSALRIFVLKWTGKNPD